MCGSLSVAEDDSRLKAVPKGPMVFGHARLNAAPMSQWVKTRHLQCKQACLFYPRKRPFSTSKEISRYTRAARLKILAERAMTKLSAGQKANKSVPLKGRKARRWDINPS